MAKRSGLIYKNGTILILLLVFCVFDLMFYVNCITVVSKGENKPKGEDIGRTLEDNYRKNEVNSNYHTQPSLSDYSNVQQKQKGIKDRLTIYNSKNRDNTPAGTGYTNREEQYGLYAPEEQAYQGYGYQDFDQTPHYGAPQPMGFSGEKGNYLYDGGFKDNREHFSGYGVPHYRPDPHAIALKGILIPLAGVALLGAAAALVTNPILLQLGVISGGKRRRRSLEDDEANLGFNIQETQHLNFRGKEITELLRDIHSYPSEDNAKANNKKEVKENKDSKKVNHYSQDDNLGFTGKEDLQENIPVNVDKRKKMKNRKKRGKTIKNIDKAEREKISLQRYYLV